MGPNKGGRPLITADQLLAHAVGDYVLQSDWMATEKATKSLAALAHAVAPGLRLPVDEFYATIAICPGCLAEHGYPKLVDGFQRRTAAGLS